MKTLKRDNRSPRPVQGRVKGVAAALAVGVLGVLSWAWVDGGRSPLRTISEPVTLPHSPGSSPEASR